MNFDKFLLKPEDEMDFLPIIPLNDGEEDNSDGIEVPPEIAILPLRNTVLFPGVVLPITVGRDKSIKAVSRRHVRLDAHAASDDAGHAGQPVAQRSQYRADAGGGHGAAHTLAAGR